MTTPGISIIATAARPENWEALYESIGANDVPFELVFVGPNEPRFSLPEGFRFIKSYVKPAQCAEIASREAIYPLLMVFGDDIIFTTERPLDGLYDTYVENADERTMVSCRLRSGGEARMNIDHRFLEGDEDSPLLPFCTLMSARLWREIGGIDRRFIAVCWDLDIAMRMLALGGEVVFSDVYVDEDTARSRGSTLMRDHRSTDRALAERLWSVDGQVHFQRALPVEPFSDEGILLRSQGPQGRWHHESELMNRIITGRTYYTLKTWKTTAEGRARRFRIRNVPRYMRRLFSSDRHGSAQ